MFVCMRCVVGTDYVYLKDSIFQASSPTKHTAELGRKERKKEIPYKEGILKDIGAHVGYPLLSWRGRYLCGGTSLDTLCMLYKKGESHCASAVA
jgi:hypothetical protein